MAYLSDSARGGDRLFLSSSHLDFFLHDHCVGHLLYTTI